MIALTKKDHQLIKLLQSDARMSVSELARQLGVSRTTAQQRLKRLETSGVITAYSVRLSEEYTDKQILSYVLINIDPKASVSLVNQLQRIHEVMVLYTVSGRVDLVAQVRVESTSRLDEVLDDIGRLTGVRSTESVIALSTKFDRR